MKQIIQSSDPVVLVGGGQATTEDLHKALTLGHLCVAADGGAALVLAAGVVPDAVIGDFDSLSDASAAQIPARALHRITEQDSTDFEKALSRITAPVVIGLGFTGGRIDHQLAVCHGMMRYAARPCVLIGAHEIMLLAPPRLSVPTQNGETVSLFPLGAVTGNSSGLKWEIGGLTFAPGRQIGTSNIATGPCSLGFEAPAMVLVLPRRLTQPVVAALSQPDAARWPVHAE